jgi:hypothetical protein
MGSDGQSVQLLAAEDFIYAVAADERVRLVLAEPGFVYAPVVEGSEGGFVYVVIDQKAIGRIPVVYGKTVELAPERKQGFWEKLFGGKEDGRTPAENIVRQGRGLPAEG